MQQSQRMIERVGEHRASNFAVVTGNPDSALRRLEVPVCQIVPDESARSLGVLAESEPDVALLGSPLALPGPRRTESGVALQNRCVESAEYPAIGKGELTVAQLIDAPDRRASNICQEESTDVP